MSMLTRFNKRKLDFISGAVNDDTHESPSSEEDKMLVDITHEMQQNLMISGSSSSSLVTSRINKNKRQHHDNTSEEELWLWKLPVTFWDIFYDILPDNYLYLTCRKGFKIRKKYAFRVSIYPIFTLELDENNQLTLHQQLQNCQQILNRNFSFIRNFSITTSRSRKGPNRILIDSNDRLFSNLTSLCLIDTKAIGSLILAQEWAVNLISLRLPTRCQDIISDDIVHFDERPAKYELSGISRLTKLEELDLGGSFCLDDDNLAEICQLTKLKKLNISNILDINDIISALPNIVPDYIFTYKGFRKIAGLVNLTHLNINGNHHLMWDDLLVLKGMDKLISLSLAGNIFFPDNLNTLHQIPQLKYLDFRLINGHQINVHADFYRTKTLKHICCEKSVMPPYTMPPNLESICYHCQREFTDFGVLVRFIENAFLHLIFNTNNSLKKLRICHNFCNFEDDLLDRLNNMMNMYQSVLGIKLALGQCIQVEEDIFF